MPDVARVHASSCVTHVLHQKSVIHAFNRVFPGHVGLFCTGYYRNPVSKQVEQALAPSSSGKVEFEQCSTRGFLVKTTVNNSDIYLTYLNKAMFQKRPFLGHTLRWLTRGHLDGNRTSNPCSLGSQQIFYTETDTNAQGKTGIRLFFRIGNTKYYISGTIDKLYSVKTTSPDDTSLYFLQ